VREKAVVVVAGAGDWSSEVCPPSTAATQSPPAFTSSACSAVVVSETVRRCVQTSRGNAHRVSG